MLVFRRPFIQSTQVGGNSSSVGFAHEIHRLTTRIGKLCLLFISWVETTLRVDEKQLVPSPV